MGGEEESKKPMKSVQEEQERFSLHGMPDSVPSPKVAETLRKYRIRVTKRRRLWRSVPLLRRRGE
jgi:hypothetical protein